MLFENRSGLVWALIASLHHGNVMLLLLNLPLVGMWVKVLRIPRPCLSADILAFAGLGACALHLNVLDTLTLLVVGVVGFLMRGSCTTAPSRSSPTRRWRSSSGSASG